MQKGFHRRLDKLNNQVDQLISTRGRMSSTCICFPLSEPPRFFYPEEQEIASRVKCPIHGERFQRSEMQSYFLYASLWLLERRYQGYLVRSEQYRRAWEAGFPDWPTREEDDNNVYLVFKDGSQYIALRKADPHTLIHWPSHQVKGPDEPTRTDANKK